MNKMQKRTDTDGFIFLSMGIIITIELVKLMIFYDAAVKLGFNYLKEQF